MMKFVMYYCTHVSYVTNLCSQLGVGLRECIKIRAKPFRVLCFLLQLSLEILNSLQGSLIEGNNNLRNSITKYSYWIVKIKKGAPID